MKSPAGRCGVDVCVAAELETHVQRLLGGRVREFQLTFMDNGLVLRGQAHTYYAKQLVQHAVMERTEVPIAANEIEVSPNMPWQ
jgi:hypothetical protein